MGQLQVEAHKRHKSKALEICADQFPNEGRQTGQMSRLRLLSH